MAIPYTVQRSVVFFIAATLLLCAAYTCCLIGQCIRHKTLYTFISGVVFIVTGLVMLFGLIMYISVLKAEIGSKLRPRYHLEPPAFVYWYGYSFLLYIIGLISCQVAGTCCIFLFIHRMRYRYRCSKAAAGYLGAAEKPAGPYNHHPHHPQTVGGGSTATAVNHLQPQHYVHYDNTMYYPCRRHPHAYINTNTLIHYNTPPPSIKRYYFSKDEVATGSPCSIHQQSNRIMGNSLKDVGTLYDFPPPPTISYQFQEPFSRENLRALSRDVTTNTVSTTADLNGEDFFSGSDHPFDDFSPNSAQHEHEFVTFDLEHPLPLRSAPSVLSMNGGGVAPPPPPSVTGSLRKAISGAGPPKGFDTDSLRRTTPV